MKEKEMQQALHAIASKDIGDNLDRWNEIQARIAAAVPRQSARQLRFALAVGLVITLLLSAGTYAYARFTRHDLGMQGVIDAGLAKTAEVTASPQRATALPTAKSTQVTSTSTALPTPPDVQITSTALASQDKNGITVTLISY